MSQCFLQKRGKSRPRFVSVQVVVKIFPEKSFAASMAADAGKLLFHTSPVLRSVKRAEVAAHHKRVGVAFLEPDFAAIPFAFFGVEDIAGLPEAVFLNHVDEDNHVQDGLIFAFAGAFFTETIGVFAKEFDDLSIKFAAGFVDFDVAFFFVGFIVFGFPGAEDVLRLCEIKSETSGDGKEYFLHKQDFMRQ